MGNIFGHYGIVFKVLNRVIFLIEARVEEDDTTSGNRCFFDLIEIVFLIYFDDYAFSNEPLDWVLVERLSLGDHMCRGIHVGADVSSEGYHMVLETIIF